MFCTCSGQSPPKSKRRSGLRYAASLHRRTSPVVHFGKSRPIGVPRLTIVHASATPSKRSASARYGSFGSIDSERTSPSDDSASTNRDTDETQMHHGTLAHGLDLPAASFAKRSLV